MTEEELIAAIQTNYPTIWAIINRPGVYDVLRQAIENNWPPSRTQVALQGTEYYKTTSDTSRQWDALQATDPATAYQRNMEMTQRVAKIVAQTGAQLQGGPDQWAFVEQALRGDWNDAQIRYNLLTRGTPSAGGETGNNAAAVYALASDYAVPLSDQAVLGFANQLTSGTITTDAVRGYMIEQAKSLYPGLVSALESGLTVRQYADPYIQIAAQDLGVNPHDITLTDTKWGRALNQVDPKTGSRVALSLDEWRRTIRTDPVYGFDTSQTGRQEASQLATLLGQRFGVLS